MDTALHTAEAPQYQSLRISAGLQDQFVGGLAPVPGLNWRMVFLRAGAARIGGPEGAEDWLHAPVLIWVPTSPSARIQVRAGSSGAMLALSDAMLANTLGHKPEAADLRLMLQERIHAPLATDRDTLGQIDHCFQTIDREAATNRPGSATLIEAQARVVAVLLWRMVMRPGEETQGVSPDQRALQTFRTLLETRFRSRWTVAAYAEAMGMSPDRLNDLCRRTLGRPPGALIRERLAYEARLMLTRSNQPISIIAGQLGFVDAAQFSKFFRQEAGEPPGRYRRRLADARGGDAEMQRSFSDWP